MPTFSTRLGSNATCSENLLDGQVLSGFGYMCVLSLQTNPHVLIHFDEHSLLASYTIQLHRSRPPIHARYLMPDYPITVALLELKFPLYLEIPP